VIEDLDDPLLRRHWIIDVAVTDVSHEYPKASPVELHR
jgi:hypothetical protein